MGRSAALGLIQGSSDGWPGRPGWPVACLPTTPSADGGCTFHRRTGRGRRRRREFCAPTGCSLRPKHPDGPYARDDFTAAASLPADLTADRLGNRDPLMVVAVGAGLLLAAYLGLTAGAVNLAVLTLPSRRRVATGLRGSGLEASATIQPAANLTAGATAGLLWSLASTRPGFTAAWRRRSQAHGFQAGELAHRERRPGRGLGLPAMRRSPRPLACCAATAGVAISTACRRLRRHSLIAHWFAETQTWRRLPRLCLAPVTSGQVRFHVKHRLGASLYVHPWPSTQFLHLFHVKQNRSLVMAAGRSPGLS